MPQVSGGGYLINYLTNNFKILQIILYLKDVKMDINLWIVLPLSFLALVIWVGSYVFIMLNVMRVDPREQEFRKKSGKQNSLIL